ncbi:rna-directed dna polymerase from mobile element jockey-like [Limosa lapponica baueri]|uniref:Rna-directed dna polymerase from mobile element jockey-like n=1 Tax=Limosa lapponica baueri TaxID=1758121 RepID=A0A2I0U9J8_LIMLA|nr:rna-directed dna polymerase from mobile element jockey-like [Limosa lapponica baueri]
MSGVPQGSVLEPVLFNIFVGNIDSGTECTLSKFINDTKLCGAVNTLEVRDAIQRDLDRLERWSCANDMKFNKAKCKVLHVSQGNPKNKYRLGRKWIESSLDEKDLGVLAEKRLNMRSQCVLAAQKVNHILGCIKRSMANLVEGGDSAPLLCTRETPPGVLHSAMESSAQEGHVGISPAEGREDDQRAGAPLYEERLRQMGLFSLEKRRLRGDLIAAFQYLKEA